jgi:hypothetical protein
VELKVKVCHPDSRFEGKLKEVFTAPFTALPVPIVWGVDCTTTSYEAVDCNPLAEMATGAPATTPPVEIPRLRLAEVLDDCVFEGEEFDDEPPTVTGTEIPPEKNEPFTVALVIDKRAP